jgi:hypothetical protein
MLLIVSWYHFGSLLSFAGSFSNSRPMTLGTLAKCLARKSSANAVDFKFSSRFQRSTLPVLMPQWAADEGSVLGIFRNLQEGQDSRSLFWPPVMDEISLELRWKTSLRVTYQLHNADRSKRRGRIGLLCPRPFGFWAKLPQRHWQSL